jgi:hypothetical protein
VVFRGRQPGVYSSLRIYEAQVNGFSHNNYIGYETREEEDEEFNQFLVNEERLFKVWLLKYSLLLKVWLFKLCMFKLCMCKLCLFKLWMQTRFRDLIIVVPLVVIAKVVLF